MRHKLPTSTLFYVDEVIKACEFDKSVVEPIKELVKPTGRRGRPRTRIDGRQIIKILKRNHAEASIKTFKAYAAAAASAN